MFNFFLGAVLSGFVGLIFFLLKVEEIKDLKASIYAQVENAKSEYHHSGFGSGYAAGKREGEDYGRRQTRLELQDIGVDFEETPTYRSGWDADQYYDYHS